MTFPTADTRSAERRARDEQIAAESHLPVPEITPGAVSTPMESHMPGPCRQPMAVTGIVENGRTMSRFG